MSLNENTPTNTSIFKSLFNFKEWNFNSAAAAGKHVVTFIGGAVSFAVAWHFLTPPQATDINVDVNLLVEGLTKTATAIAGLIAVLAPIYNSLKAAHNASPVGQASGLIKANPETKIITTPEIAAAIPSDNVVSNTEAKVIKVSK